MCTTASVRDQAGSWDGLAITFLGISSRDLISDLRMKQTRRPEDEGGGECQGGGTGKQACRKAFHRSGSDWMPVI